MKVSTALQLQKGSVNYIVLVVVTILLGSYIVGAL